MAISLLVMPAQAGIQALDVLLTLFAGFPLARE